MSSSAELLSIANSLLGGNHAVEGIFHEVSALTVIAVSFLLWHYVKTHTSRSGKPATNVSLGRQQPNPLPHETGQTAITPAQDHRVHESEQQMQELLDQKEFTRALYLFKSLERNGLDKHIQNEELFSSFVQAATRIGKFDVVEKMLRIMKRNGVAPTPRSWTTMLKLLSTKKRFSTCLLAYSIFERSIPEEQVVFSCLINAALDSGMPQEAAKILRHYDNTSLNPKDWLSYFRTYVAVGDVDQAEVTFRKVGSDMTPMMLNLLLLTCIQAKQPDRAEICLRKAHELEQGSGCKIVNVVAYNTIIKGFAQLGQSQQCFSCFQCLLQHGLEPDEITVCALVDVCLQSGEHAGIAEMLVKSCPSTNTVMCTHFMKLLIKTDRLKDALLVYEDMKSSEHSRPDLITYTMLIKAYTDIKDMDHALRILDSMVGAGCMPDDFILTRLLDCCWHAGKRDQGVGLFERLVKMGVAPSEFSILTLLKLLGSAGDHASAHELVAICEQVYGTRPSVIHYTCLMSGALRSRNYEQAWQAYVLMGQHGVSPDATAVSTLLPGLVAAQQWERALDLVNSALKDASPPLRISGELLNNALSQMIAARAAAKHVLRLQVLMQGAGVPITERNAESLS